MTDAAPLYIDVVLWAVYLLLFLTTAATVYSAIHGIRTRGHQLSANGQLLRYVAIATGGITLAVMAISYAVASTTPLPINGERFDSPVWLRLTDMFIYTSITLIVLCSAIVIAARFRR